MDALDTQLPALDAEEATRRVPLGATRELRESLPGVKTRVAETILAAGGPMVEDFPSAAARAQGIGLVPGNHESAGPSARLWWRRPPAGRTQATDLGAPHRRMVSTQGKKRAAVLGAHTLAADIWYILRRQEPYADLGVDSWDRRDTDRVRRQAVKRLETLGCEVTSPPPPNQPAGAACARRARAGVSVGGASSLGRLFGAVLHGPGGPPPGMKRRAGESRPGTLRRSLPLWGL